MSQKILKLILKIGVGLSFLSFFLVSNRLYFPYVTPKQLYFNAVVGILFWFWFYLIVKYPETRPRLSLITISLLVWLTVLLASAVAGVDFNLSFWGDTERMLGWFSLLHFFVLYLIIITVFRSKKDWQWLLSGVAATAVAIAAYALLTMRGQQYQGNVNLSSNISTLGNATYVAGVMLFAVYWLLYLWPLTRHYLIKFFYGCGLAVVLAGFIYADVSGSQAALVVSLWLGLILGGWLAKSARQRWRVWGAAALTFVVVSAAFVWPNLPFNPLRSAASQFSAGNVSWEARTFAWRAGWRGFLDKPILGYGWGNFSTPFDKYFQAGLYRWTPNEEYYDRAHNMIIEMLSTAGILGLLSYLFIFAAVVWSLWRAWQQERVKTWAMITLLALFTAYFIHNLAVFDSLANYVCLMVALALVTALTAKPHQEPEKLPPPTRAIKIINIVNLSVMGLCLAWLLYYGAWRPFLMLKTSVEAGRAWGEQSPAKFLELYNRTLSYHTPLDRDIRTFFIGLALNNATHLGDFSKEELTDFLLSLLENSRLNVALNPHDYLLLTYRGQLMYMVSAVTRNQFWQTEALGALNQGIANGGQHTVDYWVKGNILQSMERFDLSAAAWRELLSFRPDYSRVYCRLAQAELRAAKTADEAAKWNNVDDCLDQGQIKDLGRGDYLRAASKHYQSTGDMVRWQKLQTAILAK